MPDEPQTPPESGAKPDAKAPAAPPQDLAYWQGEAKKAFVDRDKAKERARELEARVLSEQQLEEYQRLRDHAAIAEEDRKRKAGEFDQWRDSITKQHETERAKLADKLKGTEAKLQDTLIGLAFAGASEWFGPKGKTILAPEIARAYYGAYVKIDEHDGSPRVVVTRPDGQPILDTQTGQPAAFEVAIGELIDALPTKDHVLRGSGKVGSGSTDGTTDPMRPHDLDQVIARARKGDKEAIAILKARQKHLGGVVMGTAFQ